LAGIEAVIPRLTAAPGCNYLLLLPCDLPYVDAAVPRELIAALRSQPAREIVYAATALADHYLCAAIRVDVLGSVTTQLDNEQRAVRDWYATRETSPLLFSGAAARGFANVNRPKDLENPSETVSEKS